MAIVTINGVSHDQIPADDPGLLLGLTIFETVRTYDGKIFRLEPHLRRLQDSAEQMQIALPSLRQMMDEIVGALEQSASDEPVRIRYTITAGQNRIVDVTPVDQKRVGAPLRVGRLDWNPPKWLPGLVKHGSRAAWIISARQQEVDEVLLVDDSDHILEANRSNIFAVVDGVVWTPAYDERFLPGVTRSALIEAAQLAKIPVAQRALPFTQRYDELYLSSTLKELAPVVEICGQPGPGSGPVGDALYKAFHALIASEL